MRFLSKLQVQSLLARAVTVDSEEATKCRTLHTFKVGNHINTEKLSDMKFLIFIPALILFSLFCNGQSTDNKIDYDYFLLGTLNDYMGREKYKEIVDRVDDYSQNDETLAYLLDSVFKYTYPDLIVTTNEKSNRIELHSASLAHKINSYYLFQPSGRGAYSGEEDWKTLNFDSLTKIPDFYSTYFDTIYTGRIAADIFKNDSERYSFIAGAYIRFGGKKDSRYSINVANSLSKVRVITTLLKELNCANVEYVMKKDYIPVGHTVYFTPTDELKQYLELIKRNLQYYKSTR